MSDILSSFSFASFSVQLFIRLLVFAFVLEVHALSKSEYISFFFCELWESIKSTVADQLVYFLSISLLLGDFILLLVRIFVLLIFDDLLKLGRSILHCFA